MLCDHGRYNSDYGHNNHPHATTSPLPLRRTRSHRQGGAGVTYRFTRVVGFERTAVVVDVGDLVRDGEADACGQRVIAGKSVGIGNQVPHRTIAPHCQRDALQRVALTHRVGAGRGPRVGGGNWLVVLVGKLCTLVKLDTHHMAC